MSIYKYKKDEWVGPLTFKGMLLYNAAVEEIDFDRIKIFLNDPSREFIYYRILRNFNITMSKTVPTKKEDNVNKTGSLGKTSQDTERTDI